MIFEEFNGRRDIPQAQALHYLQMSTEKLAKAYRLRDTATTLDTLLSSHTGFPEFFNTYLRSPAMREEYRGRGALLRNVRRDCNLLAHAVEQLAPAVARTANPANAEYPWEAGGRVIAPVCYCFPNLSFLRQPRGRTFLQLIHRAFQEYSRTL